MIIFHWSNVYENGEETVYKMQATHIVGLFYDQKTNRSINKVLHKVFGHLQNVKATNQV